MILSKSYIDDIFYTCWLAGSWAPPKTSTFRTTMIMITMMIMMRNKMLMITTTTRITIQNNDDADYDDNALWVKSGNRGNLKCLKVDDHFALIFHQKMFISFLSDAKLPKVYDRYLGLVIYVKYLMSYLQKTRRGGQGSLKFCVLAN